MARDPKRIKTIVAEFEKLWEMYPDYRLGQLVENCGINFFTDDDEVLKRLKVYSKGKGCEHPGVYRGQKCPRCGVGGK